VITNHKLVKIDKESRKLSFKDKDNKTSEISYDSVYSLLPRKGNNVMQESGLLDETNKLNIDKQTLQHKKYHNIFGYQSKN
jgi:hypothetical protein